MDLHPPRTREILSLLLSGAVDVASGGTAPARRSAAGPRSLAIPAWPWDLHVFEDSAARARAADFRDLRIRSACVLCGQVLGFLLQISWLCGAVLGAWIESDFLSWACAGGLAATAAAVVLRAVGRA